MTASRSIVVRLLLEENKGRFPFGSRLAVQRKTSVESKSVLLFRQPEEGMVIAPKLNRPEFRQGFPYYLYR